MSLGLRDDESRIDWLFIASLIGLLAISVAFIYSAKMVDESNASLAWYKQDHIRQIIWAVVGLSGAAVICLIDYHVLARFSLVAYWGTILLLALILLPFIGYEQYGARRWINLGFATIQPSEFAKLAFVLAMAHFLSRPVDELRQGPVFVKALGLGALPFALIMIEPDLGSALLFIPITLVMMWVAKTPRIYLFKIVGWSGFFCALMILNILFAPEKYQIQLHEYQRRRLLVYFNQDFAPPNASREEKRKADQEQQKYSYNVRQAMISVGSGGAWGKGYRQGTQTSLGYLPRGVAHNDFIFSVIAEEKGFIGSVVVLGLYTIVLFSGIRAAGQARDRLGKIMAAGVVTLFFSQIFINIGMNIRLMPVTGVPLPLLTYGGSSVLSSLFAAGLIQNIHLYRKAY